MSRIGKLPIEIPEGVEIAITDKNMVTIKGPLGELSQQIDKCLTVNKNEGFGLRLCSGTSGGIFWTSISIYFFL